MKSITQYITENEAVNEAILKFGPATVKKRAKEYLVQVNELLNDSGLEDYRVKSLTISKSLLEKAASSGKLDHRNPIKLGLLSPGPSLIFNQSNAIQLAHAVNAVIKKYKQFEVANSSMPASAGWENARASIGGFISGAVNSRVTGSYSGDTWLICVQIGSGVNSAEAAKLKDELYELFFSVENQSMMKGGTSVDFSEGTNFDTVGLQCRESKFSSTIADKLLEFMNKE